MPTDDKDNKISVKVKPVKGPQKITFRNKTIDASKIVSMGGDMTITLVPTKVEMSDGEAFYVEGEAIRPGTYVPSNIREPVYYGPEVTAVIAKQLKGMPIKFFHHHMKKEANNMDNKIGHVLDTKLTPDGRVLYHGVIYKNLYQKFIAALVEEEGVNPLNVAPFEAFCSKIRTGALGAASVGLRVDTAWDGMKYIARNPSSDELSLVGEGACPTSNMLPSTPSGGFMLLNSIEMDNGEIYLLHDTSTVQPGENDKYDIGTKEVSNEEVQPDDALGLLVGLARRGPDDVDLNGANEETLVALMKYMDNIKQRAFDKLHTHNQPPKVDNGGVGEDQDRPATAENNTIEVILKCPTKTKVRIRKST